MSVYVVWHGQTDWNVQKKVQGRVDTILNETGKRQAEELKESLKEMTFDKVISSPLRRAKETAEILGFQPVIIEERMTERDFGEFEGLSIKDFDADQFWSYKSNTSYRQAENIRDFFHRVYACLDEIKQTSKDEDILIVSHTGNLLAIDTYFHGIPEDDNLFRIDLKNCHVLKYDF